MSTTEAAKSFHKELSDAEPAVACARLSLRMLPHMAFGLLEQNQYISLLFIFRQAITRIADWRSHSGAAAFVELSAEFIAIAGVADALSAEAVSNAAAAASKAASSFGSDNPIHTAEGAAEVALDAANSARASEAAKFTSTLCNYYISAGHGDLEGGRNNNWEEVFREPLFAERAADVADLWPRVAASPSASGQSFEFWRRWYEGFVSGNPLEWDLQKEISLIPDEFWDNGPETVAEEIARIEAEFALRKRIAEAEADQSNDGSNRLGIGGNYPPEEIDDEATSGQVIVIWDSIAGLKDEVEAEEPDAERVAYLIERLGAALNAVFAWCAKKGDLAVDTAIKWVIPAGGAGYFVLNPAKAEAVLKAAQNWLPFLLP